MKNLKLFITTLIFAITMTSTSNAQDKNEAKATEMVNEMAAKFSTNESLKLSSDQEKALKEIYLKKITEIKKIKTEVTDVTLQKEKVKEVNKKYGKEVSDTVLTKEQKAFLKELNARKE